MKAKAETPREQLDDRDFIRHKLHDGSESSMRRYAKLVLRNPGVLSLLRYEFVNLVVPLPGSIGLVLRRLLVKHLLAESGSGAIFGRNITLRHPDNIRIGNSVVLDDYCLIDARGADSDGIRLGDRVIVNRGASIQAKVGEIAIGEGTGIGAYSQIISQGPIQIAENVSIAGSTMIAGGRYDVELPTDAPDAKKRFTGGPIVIDANVRLGMRSTILDGVHIGRNAIVAPGSVVFDDVPADTVVIGCPARPLRQRKSSARDSLDRRKPDPSHVAAVGQVDRQVSGDRRYIETVIQSYLVDVHYAEFGPGKLGNDDSLFDNNVFDSVGLVGVITMLESHFGIELDEDDLIPEKLSTVNGLASIVECKH